MSANDPKRTKGGLDRAYTVQLSRANRRGQFWYAGHWAYVCWVAQSRTQKNELL